MDAFVAENAKPLHLQIAKHLEKRILSDELKAGERLPNTTELASVFGVTPVTIQKSLSLLVKLDLVQRLPKRGTFVKEHRTSNQIGLVFGYDPFHEQSLLYLRLLELFRSKAEEQKINLKIYLTSSPKRNPGIPYELRRDAESANIKSLIAVSRSPELSKWLEEQTDIIWTEPIKTNFHDSVKMGTEYLINRGYKRIMVVSMYPKQIPYEDWTENHLQEKQGFDEAVANSDIKAQFVSWGQSEIDGYEMGKKVFSQPEKPDAIFVHHDVVCRGLLLALMELGLKIPENVAVLTHSNAGCEFASPVKLSRIEYDPELMVNNCLKLVQKIQKEQISGNHFDIPKIVPKLIPGKSCGEKE